MRLAPRVAHLEGPLPGGRLPGWVRDLAVELAGEAGLELMAVVRETQVVLAEAKAAGALGSTDELIAYTAGVSGRSPAAILAEAQQVLERR